MGLIPPLHLAFSCYVVRADGQVLLTKRSPLKRMFPSVWTNACCGHPRPGEPLTDAVCRHLRDELSLRPHAMHVVLPDFTYRAEMANGLVEHEVCPVFVAEVDTEPSLDQTEADDMLWLSWSQLQQRAIDAPESLSPWSVDQILLGRLRCGHETLRNVRTRYDLLRTEVIAGQYLDLRLAGLTVTAEQALFDRLTQVGPIHRDLHPDGPEKLTPELSSSKSLHPRRATMKRGPGCLLLRGRG